jgi:hypothetical protein
MSKRPRLHFAPPITPDHLLTLTLGAYYATVKLCTPPADEPEPASWSGPNDFADQITEEVRRRMARHLYGPLVDQPVNWEADDLREMGAGRSPADMGHGWPASAPGHDAQVSAVGPALGSFPEAGDAVPVAGCGAGLPADRLFLATSGQDLPRLDLSEDTETQLGTQTHA